MKDRALQKLAEFLNSQLGTAQDGLRGTRLDRFGAMEDYCSAAGKILTVPEKDVGTPLPEEDEACFLESSNESVTGNVRQVAHAATSTSRSMTSEGGIGWRSALRPSRYRATASLMFARASASVSPWLAQPARAGTKTEKPPPTSGCNTTVNRRTIGSPPIHRIPYKEQQTEEQINWIGHGTTFTVRLPI